MAAIDYAFVYFTNEAVFACGERRNGKCACAGRADYRLTRPKAGRISEQDCEIEYCPRHLAGAEMLANMQMAFSAVINKIPLADGGLSGASAELAICYEKAARYIREQKEAAMKRQRINSAK